MMEATTQPTLKNSATAIWGFVLGTLGLLTCGLTSIPGLILSIIGTVKTKNPENGLKGHGMAVSGIVLSGVAMLAGPVIASIALPVFMQTGKYMERVEAQQTAVQLYGAMRNYFSEYKQMPDLKTVTTDANGDFQIESNSQELTKILTGENKRGIVFYQPSSQIIDPWGNPFQILFDGNLDGSLEVPSRSGSGTETIPNNIAVWSFDQTEFTVPEPIPETTTFTLTEAERILRASRSPLRFVDSRCVEPFVRRRGSRS